MCTRLSHEVCVCLGAGERGARHGMAGHQRHHPSRDVACNAHRFWGVGRGLGLGTAFGVPVKSRFLTGGSSTGPVNAANRRSMDVVPVLNKASLHACLPKPMATKSFKARCCAAPSLTEVSSGAVRAVFVGMEAMPVFLQWCLVGACSALLLRPFFCTGVAFCATEQSMASESFCCSPCTGDAGRANFTARWCEKLLLASRMPEVR